LLYRVDLPNRELGARMKPDPGNVDEALSDSLDRVEFLATNSVPRKE
jgi:hypothetical protein